MKKFFSHLLYFGGFLFGLNKKEIGIFRSLFVVLLLVILINHYHSYQLALEKKRFIQEFSKSSLPPLVKKTWGPRPGKAYQTTVPKQMAPLNINKADSLEWIALKGIGPGFAKRILAFREKLGGFYSIQQLKEVYGLDPAWVEKNAGGLTIGEGIYRKTKVNQVEWEGFRHPYVPYKQINTILIYRKQHGNFHDFEDFKSIKLFDSTLWIKSKPYLDFEISP